MVIEWRRIVLRSLILSADSLTVVAIFDHEITIDAPIGFVFAQGTDPENWLRWTPSMTDVEKIEETEEGTRYRTTMQILGRTTTSEDLFTVDEEEYHTVNVFNDDAMRGEMHYDYTETEDGTHVHMRGEFEDGTSLFDKVLAPVTTRYLDRQFGNSFQTMKDLIESEYADTERR